MQFVANLRAFPIEKSIDVTVDVAIKMGDNAVHCTPQFPAADAALSFSLISLGRY